MMPPSEKKKHYRRRRQRQHHHDDAMSSFTTRNGNQNHKKMVLLMVILCVSWTIEESLVVVSGYIIGTNNHNHNHPRRLLLRRRIKTTTTTTIVTRAAANDNAPGNIPVPIEKELGCSPTLTVLFGSFLTVNERRMNDGSSSEGFFFDPLGLATDTNFAHYRECELKHSRIAMVSSVTCILQTVYKHKSTLLLSLLERSSSSTSSTTKQPSTHSSSAWWNTLLRRQPPLEDTTIKAAAAATVVIESTSTTMTTTDVVATTPTGVPSATLGELWTSIRPSPLGLLEHWTAPTYLGAVVVCGFLELWVLYQRDPNDMPGDYQTGYFGVRSYLKNERSLVAELENGRLAMLVMLYYVMSDLYVQLSIIL
jgi:hypothetical protein